MKVKSSLFLLVALVLSLALVSSSFGQGGVTWYGGGNGVTLSSTVAGASTQIGLNVILASNGQLTKNQYFKIRLSSFQVDSSQAITKSNYTFTSPNSNLRVDSSQYNISFSRTNNVVTFTLADNDNVLIPGDTLNVTIASAVAKNKGYSGTSDDITVYFSTEDQPQLSPDQDSDALTSFNDLKAMALTLADSNAAQSTYLTIGDTVFGQLPRDGKLTVSLPDYFSYASSLDTSMVKVYLSSVSSSNRVTASSVTRSTAKKAVIQLAHSADIASQSYLIIQIGNTTNSGLTNPTVYEYDGSTQQLADTSQSLTFTTGKDVGTGTEDRDVLGTASGDFFIVGTDADGDTVFADKEGNTAKTTKVVSNWWYNDDNTNGGVYIGNNYSNSITLLDLQFKVGEAITSSDSLGIDLSAWDFYSAATSDSLDYYSFSSGVSWSDTTGFKVYTDTTNEIVYVVPKSSHMIYPNSIVKLRISDQVLKNKGEKSDLSVKLWSTNQKVWLTDRDTSSVVSNPGAGFLFFALSDTNAGEWAAIDSGIFVPSANIPKDGKLVISVPYQFDMSDISSIDSATIQVYPAGSKSLIGTKPTDYYGTQGASGTKVKEVSKAAGTIGNNEITLELDLPADISAGDTVTFTIGDSSGAVQDWAFRNPVKADSGEYPTNGLKAGFTFEVQFANGDVIQRGTNAANYALNDSARTIANIVANHWVSENGMLAYYNSTSIPKLPVDATNFYATFDSTQQAAGDSVGLRFAVNFGSELHGAGTLAGEHLSHGQVDTVYFDLSDFLIIDSEVSTSNIHMEKDETSGETARFKSATVSNGILALELNDEEHFVPDSTYNIYIKRIGVNDPSGAGGMLFNKGARTDLKVNFWTSRQHWADTSSTALTVLGNFQPDSCQIMEVFLSDSAANEISQDTVILRHYGVIEPGSTIKLTAKNGFNWNASGTYNNTTLVMKESGFTSDSTRSFSYSSVVLSDTVVTITLASTDTIGVGGSDEGELTGGGLGIADSIKFTIGDGTNNLLQNPSVSEASFTGRRKTIRPLSIAIYDASGRLYQATDTTNTSGGELTVTNHNFATNYPASTRDSAVVVTNFINTIRSSETTIGDIAAAKLHEMNQDTAGQILDTLMIVFEPGMPIIGDSPSTRSLVFTFDGLIGIHKDSLEDESKYIFSGDTSGVSTDGSSFTVTAATALNQISFEFQTGDTLGLGVETVAGASPTITPAGNFKDTLQIVGLFRVLGTDRSVFTDTTSGSGDYDDVNITISTGRQTDTSSDTVQYTAVVPVTNDAIITSNNLSSVFGQNTLSTATAGTATTFNFGSTGGTSHGYISGTGYIDLVVPSDTSTASKHEFTFQNYTSLAGGAIDTSLAALNILNGSTIADASVTIDTLGGGDSTRIRLKLNNSSATVEDTAAFYVSISNVLINPREATTGGSGYIASDYADATNANPTGYPYWFAIRDANGDMVAAHYGTTPISVDPGTMSKLQVMKLGEIHDPGSDDGVRNDPVNIDTVNTGIPFVVQAVDQYYNVVTYATAVTISTTEPNYLYLGDEEPGSAAHITMAGGKGAFDSEDSLKFYTAADTSDNAERTSYHTITATSGSYTGVSRPLIIKPKGPAYVLPMLLSSGQTYTPGDTANSGVSGSPSIVQFGTYTVTLYLVDSFYNRIDSTHVAGSNLAEWDIASGSSGAGASATSGEFTGGKSTLTISPSTNATFNIVFEDKNNTSRQGTLTFTVSSVGYTVSFGALSDSTEAIGKELPFSASLNFTGSFGSGSNDGWAFYIYTTEHPTDTLAHRMSELLGGILVRDTVRVGDGGATVAYADTADIRELVEGKKYWLAVTLPAVNDSVRAWSSGFTVRHWPVVATDSIAVTPSSGNVVLNSADGSTSQNIKFAIEDYNSPIVDVKLFLSNIDTLNEVNLDLTDNSGTYTVNGLNGASRILSSESISRFDTLKTFSMMSPDTLAAGSSYVYVVANDGQHQDVARSTNMLILKHAPAITLDMPITGTDSVNTKDQRYLSVNWARAGDIDVDDNATISIYMDTTTKNYTSSDYATIIANSTKLSTSTIYEDNDFDGDHYVIDLLDLESSKRPISGGVYDFYAVITDGKDTTASRSPGDVKFTHSPYIMFDFNLGGALGKGTGAAVQEQVVLNKGESFQFNFTASDLDQTQYIRFVVSTDGNSDYDDFYWSADGETASVGSPISAWIVNSTSGGPGSNGVNVIDVTSMADSVVNWNTGNMTSIEDGEYYVYAFIRNDGLNAEASWSNANTEKYMSTGRVKLVGTDNATVDYDMEVYPNVVALSKDDKVRFYLKVDGQSRTVDDIAFYLNIDSTKWTVIDQDTTIPGTQPFGVESNYFFGSTSTLEDTMYDGTGGYKYLDFKKFNAGGGVPQDTIVAYFELVTKGTDSTTTIEEDIYFVTDGANNRLTTLRNDGVSFAPQLPSPAMRTLIAPLGRITGYVPLQGRDQYAKEISFQLRPTGSLNPITTTNFVSTNDQNSTTDGVQITTDRDGYYELKAIPAGNYDIVALTNSYVSGKYPSAVNVVAGDIETGINPTADNSADPVVYDWLRGGDVSSQAVYGTGDNRVDGNDITYLQDNWNSTTATIGDIDGDGIIQMSDLSITAGNMSIEGVPPIYGAKGNNAKNNTNAKFEIAGMPEVTYTGQEFEVQVMAREVDDLSGYTYTVSFDPEKVELVSENGNRVSEGDFLKTYNNATLFFTYKLNSGLQVVNTMLGWNETAKGAGVVSTMKFRSLVDDIRPEVTLTNVAVANSIARLTNLKDVSQIPEDFKLSQNYPNPFNPETKIRFQLPHDAKVKMKVYNILGQEIATLVNKELKAGYHMIKWNGQNNFGVKVASGMYIYRIEAGDFKSSKKMILLK